MADTFLEYARTIVNFWAVVGAIALPPLVFGGFLYAAWKDIKND